MGAGGGGGLLSKRPSGILEAAYCIVLLLKASFPILSSVSRMLKEGNIPKTCALYPGNLTTSLLSKSNCNRDLIDLKAFKCSTFYILLAPSMIV